MALSKSSSHWHPCFGGIALYVGQTRAKTRNVRVLAEASKGRIVVEAIGRQGKPVQFTVLKTNLFQPQPDLFA